MSEKLAACVLIPDGRGKFLGVSRKDDLNDFGLPGGKTDEGEEVHQTAIRETIEETGLSVYNLYPLLKAFTRNHLTQCYLARGCIGAPQNSEEGRVKWCTREELESGTFGEYNKNVFQNYDYYQYFEKDPSLNKC